MIDDEKKPSEPSRGEAALQDPDVQLAVRRLVWVFAAAAEADADRRATDLITTGAAPDAAHEVRDALVPLLLAAALDYATAVMAGQLEQRLREAKLPGNDGPVL